MYNNELYHFGIRGMKWGVRKKVEESTNSYNKKEVAKGVAKGAGAGALAGYGTLLGTAGLAAGVGAIGIAAFNKGKTNSMLAEKVFDLAFDENKQRKLTIGMNAVAAITGVAVGASVAKKHINNKAKETSSKK